jgi:predicted PurR-regulated permease PerM
MASEPVGVTGLLPHWLRLALAYSLAGLFIGAVGWVVLQVLLSVAVVTVAVLGALLLAALMSPVERLLSSLRTPRWLAALASVLFLLAVPATALVFVVNRAADQLDDLQGALAAGVTQLRAYLTAPPISLDPARLDEVTNLVVTRIYDAAPDPVDSAALALQILSSAVLALFLLFFLVKDGPKMWRWLLGLLPAGHRGRVDGTGKRAWWTLTRYVAGSVVIAFVDAVSIGLALFVLGVPLALSLALLIFFTSFIPLLGATLSGAAAVLVTLVTLGVPQALIVLLVVVLVQQLEGNLLQPVVMGRAVQLHPAVILVVVTAGGLLGGILGAIVAVPLTAVTYQVVHFLADTAAEPANGPPAS